MNRRKFFSNSAFSAAGLVLANGLGDLPSRALPRAAAPAETAAASYNQMREVRKYRKLDAHIHVDLYHGGQGGCLQPGYHDCSRRI